MEGRRSDSVGSTKMPQRQENSPSRRSHDSYGARPKEEARRLPLAESWAEYLRSQNMPEYLIDLVKKAEFEAWAEQQCHKTGHGLFYSEFRDLPPRFQRKFFSIMQSFIDETELQDKLKLNVKLDNCGSAIDDQTASSDLLSQFENKCKQQNTPSQVEVINSPTQKPVDHSMLPFIQQKQTNNSGNDKELLSSHKEIEVSGIFTCEQLENSESKECRSWNDSRGSDKRNESASKRYVKKRDNRDVKRNQASSDFSHSNSTGVEGTASSCERFSHHNASSDRSMPLQRSPGSKKGVKDFRNFETCSGESSQRDENNILKLSTANSAEKSSKMGSQIHSASVRKNECKEVRNQRRNVKNPRSKIQSVPEVKTSRQGDTNSGFSKLFKVIAEKEKENILSGVHPGPAGESVSLPLSHKEPVRKPKSASKHHLVQPSITDALVCSKQSSPYNSGGKRITNKNHDSPEHNFKHSSSMRSPNHFSKSVVPPGLVEFKNSIELMVKNALQGHSQKVERVASELKELNVDLHKDGMWNNKIKAVRARLRDLKDMENVFYDYSCTILSKIHAKSSGKKLVEEIKELKNDFSRECNCLAASLPIYSKKNEILQVVQNNQVAIIVADTGSGKSTQLVQYLWQAGFAEKGLIVCTQPRKVAAVSICNYISGQLGSAVGQLVGYEAGVRKKISKSTKIVYMTDFALLRKFARTKNLSDVSTIIVDEAHERSLFTDILLGMLKMSLEAREDLKVIVTSATIDPHVFQHYFGLPKGAILCVPGRTYPVTVQWQSADAVLGADHVNACVNQALSIHHSSDDGGILVFLTSPGETEDAVRLFGEKEENSSSCCKLKPVLLTLHGRQDTEDQMSVFHSTPRCCRKIIFATNAAETSVTIPEIKYVVDCGLVKELQYDSEKKRSAIVLTFINQSSAEQRKGRAGRTRPGICYRMYSKKNFEDMSESPCPEILRSSLRKALLKVMELGVDPEQFDFLDAPPMCSIKDAIASLENLGAVSDKQLTALGKEMAWLPLEPQWGKLVLRGIEEGIGYESVIVAALASLTGRVFYRTEENKNEADHKKLPFCNRRGDFHTFLNIYSEWLNVENVQKHAWCLNHCISSKSMKIAHAVVTELCETLLEMKKGIKRCFEKPPVFDPKFEAVLFECLSENLCVFSNHEKAGYLSPYLDGSYFIHPSSALCYLGEKTPQFVIYCNLVKTSRSFMMNVATIEESVICDANVSGKFDLQVDLLKCLRVLPIVIRPVGELILVRYILGKEGSNVRKLETEIKKLCKSESFHIDVSVQKGEIVIHIEQQHHKIVSPIIQHAIEEGRAELAKEELLCPVTALLRCSSIIECGGNIRDVILPGEYREITVGVQNGRTFSPDRMINTLEKYGTLISYHASDDTSELSVTYQKVSHAERAVDGLQNSNIYWVKPKIHISEMTEKNLPLFRVEVSWCRLQCKGTGYIDFFDSADCIEASYKLTQQSIYVDDVCVIVEPLSHGGTTLHMRKLPYTADEHEIKAALKERFPSHLKVKDVSLNREKPHNSFGLDLEITKKRLSDLFAPFTPLSKLIIDMQIPEPADPMWHAVIYFTNFEDGEKAISSLKNCAKIGRHKAKLNTVFKASVYCRKNIYSVLSKSIHECVGKYERLQVLNSFSVKDAHSSRFRNINFTCKTLKHLTEMRDEIVRITSGLHISCLENPNLHFLFSKGTEISFQQIMKDTDTVIMLDSIRKLISVYGSPKACAHAEQEIQCFSANSRLLKAKVFDLCGGDMPSGFLKAVYQKYGHSLQGLIRNFHLESASINVLRHQLILKGSSKRIGEAEACLEEICSKLHEDFLKKKENGELSTRNKEFCPVCFSEVSCDGLRLENCGHVACKSCLLLQMQSDGFPMVCPQNECKRPYFIEDFRKIFVGYEQIKKDFCIRALQDYIIRNPDDFRQCPTPNCQMFYRTSSKKREFSCPGCENDICTRCHALSHIGVSCDMYQKTKIDEDYPLKVWMNEDGRNRKICPKCTMAIEKDGGCNHVACSSCGTHLCWLCLESFKSSADVYEHFIVCPENVGP